MWKSKGCTARRPGGVGEFLLLGYGYLKWAIMIRSKLQSLSQRG